MISSCHSINHWKINNAQGLKWDMWVNRTISYSGAATGKELLTKKSHNNLSCELD